MELTQNNSNVLVSRAISREEAKAGINMMDKHYKSLKKFENSNITPEDFIQSRKSSAKPDWNKSTNNKSINKG